MPSGRRDRQPGPAAGERRPLRGGHVLHGSPGWHGEGGDPAPAASGDHRREVPHEEARGPDGPAVAAPAITAG
ncbi:MAG: hypothetical protein EXR72_24770 [Myxococcales bacterium]|nr:hypothetical protein [Myxococcales bacterium]